METSYGIGVTNRYALFIDDESDPLETLKLKEQEKEAKKKNKVAEKENKAKVEPQPKAKAAPVAKKQPRDAPKAQESNRDGKPNHPRANGEGKPERGERTSYNKRDNAAENREERNNRRNREDRPFNGNFENKEDRPPRRDGDNFDNRRGGRGGGLGGAGNKSGGGRGGGRGRFNDDRRGKREYDRQSGSDKTGIKPVDKREGGGAHNWGSHKDVIEEADKSNDMANWEEKPENTTTSTEPEQVTSSEEAETTHVEEEQKQMTLDEYKAQKASRAKPQYNIRKAGEGEDPSQWKKMYALNKRKDQEEDQETDEEEYYVSEYPQRVGRQQRVLDIDFHFTDNRRGMGGRGRGGRGARGGNRGNRTDRMSSGGGGAPGGGRFRGSNEEGEERGDLRNAPKMDDNNFPTLKGQAA